MKVTFEIVTNLFRKPFTQKYPAVKPIIFEHFRGRLHYYSARCIGCRLCETNCPIGAVKFYKKGKIDFDMSKCIYCGLCQDVCQPKAIVISNEFECASADKNEVKKQVTVR